LTVSLPTVDYPRLLVICEGEAAGAAAAKP
jgi:hypothetical protein